MPIFRLNKAFSVARNVTVFLNLEGGVTRGATPEAGDLSSAREKISKQSEGLRRKDQEILRLKNELRVAEERVLSIQEGKGETPDVVEQYKEKAEDLRNARKKINRQRKILESKDHEIFRLRNELRAAKERAENAADDRSTLQAGDAPEPGMLPDFVIIGAQRCGTSTLYHLLTQHPNVERAASKELHYFDNRFDEGIEWYRRCFPPPGWKDGERFITGEATPRYLLHPLVPERMAEVLPKARLISLLRNPVDRAYSNYQHMVRKGIETRSFEEAVEIEKTRLLDKEDAAFEHEHYISVIDDPRSAYLERGIYVDQLRRWSKFYDDEQLLVLKSEDFFESTVENLKLVLRFLDLPDWEPEASEIKNRSRYKEKMDPSTRQQLEGFFEPHNQRLYEYLGVDFGW